MQITITERTSGVDVTEYIVSSEEEGVDVLFQQANGGIRA
jgi:hypothetical protein